MNLKIKEGISKKCGVYVPKNVYGLKKPYERCKIICPPAKPLQLDELVFEGSREECEEFINNEENCKCYNKAP